MDAWSEEETRAVVRDELRSLMAAVLADPDVEDKSMAGYLLQRLGSEEAVPLSRNPSPPSS